MNSFVAGKNIDLGDPAPEGILFMAWLWQRSKRTVSNICFTSYTISDGVWETIIAIRRRGVGQSRSRILDSEIDLLANLELNVVHGRYWFGLLLRTWTLILALTLFSKVTSVHAQDAYEVDLELALLVDVSASVSNEEFHLQVAGLATALRSEDVREAIRSVARQGIAICVIQWANSANQRIAVGWSLVQRDADVLKLADRIASMSRMIDGGHTALGDAITFGLRQLESNRFAGVRRVIDLSGDGRSNDGRPLRAAREEVIKHGITINGLAILNEIPLLDDYFRDHLIGGEDAFYIVAHDYTDFTQAMIQKLVREIRSVPVSKIETPQHPYKASDEHYPIALRNSDEQLENRLSEATRPRDSHAQKFPTYD